MAKIGIKAASLFVFSTALIFSARLFAGDLKIKSVVTFTYKTADTYKSSESTKSSQHEETVYVQGSRERREFRIADTADVRQPHTAEITNCQNLSAYRVDFNTRKYAEMKLPGFPIEQQVLMQLKQQEKWAKKNYAAQTIDTGERKIFFGLTASHIITSVHGISSRERSKATIDGWYVNLPEAGCVPEYMRRGKATEIRASFLSTGASKTVYTGFVPPGLAVQEVITTSSRFEQNGHHIEIVSVEEKKVVELSQELLDSALFNAPQGFEKVEQLPWDVNIPRPALHTR